MSDEEVNYCDKCGEYGEPFLSAHGVDLCKDCVIEIIGEDAVKKLMEDIDNG